MAHAAAAAARTTADCTAKWSRGSVVELESQGCGVCAGNSICRVMILLLLFLQKQSLVLGSYCTVGTRKATSFGAAIATAASCVAL
jgi:hypothetical protein